MLSEIRISVRALVEFIMRSGDIDRRRKTASGPEVMLEGANIHRAIQRRMGKNYHAEVYMSATVERSDCIITVDGRADGLIIPGDGKEEGRIEAHLLLSDEENIKAPAVPEPVWDIAPDLSTSVVIDEIKTTYRDLEKMKKPVPEHLAQAMCYAFMAAQSMDLPAIGVRMTYCNTETRETRYFDNLYSREEITAWFAALMKEYARWADFETGWRKIRNMSIETLRFPYEYRSGQRELMAQVYSSTEAGGRLFVMAPTGVGKTLATVYPSLKSLAKGGADRIFYLTAKTITRTVASGCLDILRPHLRLKSVTLTAKEKICPLGKCECNPDACKYAKGHFDRINDAMYDLLINEDSFTRETITEYSRKHTVCPFEFSLDMSLFSDMIICDYNYVFDPNVYLRRFFGDGSKNSGAERFLFLVDEAHNLTERAMKMYSARIVKEEILDVKRLVKDEDPRLARALESCNRYLLEQKRLCNDVKVAEDFESFVALLLRLGGRIEQFLDEHEHFEHSEEVLEFYFGLRHFLNIYENMIREDYVLYTKLLDDGNFSANLMCANPAGPVRNCTDRSVFTVFFSATLLPIDYYRMMLGADEGDAAVYAKSVFDPANRALLVAKDVTSKYTRRGESEYDRMAEYISAIVSAKQGNYMVFFPSFAMLENVYELFMSRYHDGENQTAVVQSPSMTEAEREGFLSLFAAGEGDYGDEEYTGGEEADETMLPDLAPDMEIEIDSSLDDEEKKTLIGFCVLGGIFSEGIDLKNDALIGAIIVGTGLPMVCPERELLRRCYSDMGLDGFDYAYRFPGMNKVLQAAGRVIRTEEDRGVVALLDERFLGRDYLRLFPREWKDYGVCRADDVNEALEQFWTGPGEQGLRCGI
ncbi:MAG: ATP-dependent DNA helicase [Lachnospiraceae bacterium]|nr:ATP-dependent DNA helicase [Lachnospiraceae bacterium]